MRSKLRQIYFSKEADRNLGSSSSNLKSTDRLTAIAGNKVNPFYLPTSSKQENITVPPPPPTSKPSFDRRMFQKQISIHEAAQQIADRYPQGITPKSLGTSWETTNQRPSSHGRVLASGFGSVLGRVKRSM